MTSNIYLHYLGTTQLAKADSANLYNLTQRLLRVLCDAEFLVCGAISAAGTANPGAIVYPLFVAEPRYFQFALPGGSDLTLCPAGGSVGMAFAEPISALIIGTESRLPPGFVITVGAIYSGLQSSVVRGPQYITTSVGALDSATGATETVAMYLPNPDGPAPTDDQIRTAFKFGVVFSPGAIPFGFKFGVPTSDR